MLRHLSTPGGKLLSFAHNGTFRVGPDRCGPGISEFRGLLTDQFSLINGNPAVVWLVAETCLAPSG